MTPQAPLILYGVFRELIHHRVPLGVADYLDALRALEWQSHSDNPPHLVGREGLRQLCRVLWARSPDEVRLIDRIFDRIPPPTWDELQYFSAIVDRLEPSTDNRPRDPAPNKSDSPRDAPAHETAGTQVAVAFESVSSAGALPLPHPVLPRVSDTFIMQPQTIVSARALAVLWRRYRRMVRTGPRTELDLDATTAENVRRGVLDRPVLRPRRTNSARLLILADASPSMSAWGPFLDALTTSIALSRLTSARLMFFANVPRRSLFTSLTLTDGTPAQAIYQRYAGAGLLVISDAGAARGFLNRSRVAQTQQFLADANRRTRAIVWINPMPQSRWAGTTAQAITAGAGATFLPLDYSSLLRAVDILRGVKGQ